MYFMGCVTLKKIIYIFNRLTGPHGPCVQNGQNQYLLQNDGSRSIIWIKNDFVRFVDSICSYIPK